MISAPSRYAHLPTKEEDYKYIITNIENGMFVETVDDIIAELKSKETIEHHYRTSLKSLGLFDYNYSSGRKVIELNSHVYLFKKNIITLKELLKIIVESNNDIMDVKVLAESNGIFDFNVSKMINILSREYPNRNCKNILRWFRPIIFLLTYVYSKDNINSSELYECLLKDIQNEYFNIATEYGEPVSIEEIEQQIVNKYPNININDVWKRVYSDEKLEYKLSFITFPKWFTEHKHLVINGKVFTHIRIKKNII